MRYINVGTLTFNLLLSLVVVVTVQGSTRRSDVDRVFGSVLCRRHRRDGYACLQDSGSQGHCAVYGATKAGDHSRYQ